MGLLLLMPLLVSASPSRLSGDARAQLARALPDFSGPLASFGKALGPLRTGAAPASPSVAAVRERLKTQRSLEIEARTVFASAARSGVERASVHAALALAWTELAELEEALSIEGEGDTPGSLDAVRKQAESRANDARAIAAAEAFDCVHEPGVSPALAKACGEGIGPDSTLRQGTSASEVATSRGAEIRACWQEHLLTQGGDDPLQVLATLEFDQTRTSAVSFAPTLNGPRAKLGECLSTRLLGWRVVEANEVEAVELPLKLEAPSK